MLGGVAFRVSIGGRGDVVVDFRPLVPLDILIDLVAGVRLRPTFDDERGLFRVEELLPWDIFLSLLSVALAPGLIFLGRTSPLLTRRIDFRPDETLSTSVAVSEPFLAVPAATADPGRSKADEDFDFIDCLPVRWSDDSATLLGLPLSNGTL